MPHVAHGTSGLAQDPRWKERTASRLVDAHCSGGCAQFLISTRAREAADSNVCDVTASRKTFDPVLRIRNLRVTFGADHGSVQVVQDVSLSIDEGETLGIVGESGSGKSMTCLAAMGLVPAPGIVEADAIELAGRDLVRMTDRERRQLRGREMSMVFQDPMTSLNPLMTIGRQLCEVPETHERCTPREARRRAAAALADVGIASPEERLDAYPHELSGGMRQRVMIAMALLCKPKLVFADEPTTALDVSVQAQILELLSDLQAKHGTAIVLITHSLGVVAHAARRVLVMYAGRIVESADARELFDRPLHPYTRALLQSVPRVGGELAPRLRSIGGQPPDLARRRIGCSFAPRCSLAFERCTREVPVLAPASIRAFASDSSATDPKASASIANAAVSDASAHDSTAHGVRAGGSTARDATSPATLEHLSACFLRDDLAQGAARFLDAPLATTAEVPA
jgi:oligopeptide/dipeptide ABC transporter ATP-binding protein